MSTTASTQPDLYAVNARLGDAPAMEVVQWAGRTFGDGLALTTSFGVQSAVMLHLVSQRLPGLPVIFIDTGFHFAETYRFADELTERLELNLKVFSPPLSPAWFAAREGRLWDTDPDRYDRVRKVEPMQRALGQLNITATLTGLRRQQTNHRQGLRRVELQNGRHKVMPILDWSTKDVHDYLKEHDLPYHPLHERGYASVGDWHSTRPIGVGEDERAGRFNGLKQECGLHLPLTEEESASRDSSGL